MKYTSRQVDRKGNENVIPAKPVPAGSRQGAGNYKRYWIPVFTGNPGCPIKNLGHDGKYDSAVFISLTPSLIKKAFSDY